MKLYGILAVVVSAMFSSQVFGTFQVVADPSAAEFGFESPSPGNTVSSWSLTRMSALTQTGDGSGGGTAAPAAGVQSARIDPTGNNARMVLNTSPTVLPGHTARFSFAFQLPTGNGDFEAQVFLQDPATAAPSRAIWLYFDNGQFSYRDEANGNGHTNIGTYTGDQWYEAVVEKPVWANGNAGQPLTISLYDSSTGNLVGQNGVTLGETIAGLGVVEFNFGANVDLLYMNVDHIRYVLDDAGAPLPAFSPLLLPEPGTLALLAIGAAAIARRRMRA